MSEQLRVDPHALRAAAPAFDSLAAACDDALRALLGALDGEGRCWGQDDTVPPSRRPTRGRRAERGVVRVDPGRR
jgi:hypothetical protein